MAAPYARYSFDLIENTSGNIFEFIDRARDIFAFDCYLQCPNALYGSIFLAEWLLMSTLSEQQRMSKMELAPRHVL